MGTEFQLVALLAALLYRLFGVHEWIGRAVSIAFFAASLPRERLHRGPSLDSQQPLIHVFHYWLIGVLCFLVTVARHPHQWYHLALVPVAAALAGAALDRLADLLARAWGRGPAICAGLVLYLSLGFSAYTQVAPLYQPWALPAFKAGVALRQLAPRDALVAVVDGGDPTAIYYSGRKGWHFPRDFGSPVAQDAEAIRELETLRREGARYLVFLRNIMWWFDQYPDFGRAVTISYRRIQETEDYVIFDLSPRTRDWRHPGARAGAKEEYARELTHFRPPIPSACS